MLWTPQKGAVRVEHNTGSVGLANPGTTVTTGATSGTKGAAAVLFTVTSFDAYLIWLIASNYAAAATDAQLAIDIMVGGATEEVVIPNLLGGSCGNLGTTTAKGPRQWMFPLYIPAGTRLTAKAAGARTTTSFQLAAYLFGGDAIPHFRVGSKVTTYGVSAVPNGTAITPGVSGAEGAWTQITAATTEDHFAFVPSFQVGSDTTWSVGSVVLDLGVGAITEEQISEGWWYGKDNAEAMTGPFPCMPIFQDVPSGTRLVLRASNSGPNDNAYNAAIHAVS